MNSAVPGRFPASSLTHFSCLRPPCLYIPAPLAPASRPSLAPPSLCCRRVTPFLWHARARVRAVLYGRCPRACASCSPTRARECAPCMPARTRSYTLAPPRVRVHPPIRTHARSRPPLHPCARPHAHHLGTHARTRTCTSNRTRTCACTRCPHRLEGGRAHTRRGMQSTASAHGTRGMCVHA